MISGQLLGGRVAIVTGAARGIGFATAVRLTAEGARVVIADLDEPAARAAAAQISTDAVAVAGDITATDVPSRVVEAAITTFGRLDIVINNAGYNWDSPLEAMTDSQFQAMLDIHVVAPFRMLRAAAPHLLTSADGGDGDVAPFRKVVNVSSVSGTMGNPNQANYNAGKAAIVGLTKGLAKEWGPRGVNVNAVAPGFVDTRLTGLADAGEAIEVGGQRVPLGIPDQHRRKGSELVPLGRPGTPDEIARAVLFLASPLADYVHGQVLSVTGGLMLGMSS
jgi:3-oxoacyl-[acyl-carrier protein] reductase